MLSISLDPFENTMDRKKIRKRKRPSYLNDFLEDHTEDDKVQERSTTISTVEALKKGTNVKSTEVKVEPLTDKCCLCEEDLTKRFDIETSTGSSELTFSIVLNRMFCEDNENVPKLKFSTGFLCTFCKVPIQDLDLLQHKVQGIKKVILTRADKKIKNITLQQKLNLTLCTSGHDGPTLENVLKFNSGFWSLMTISRSFRCFI